MTRALTSAIAGLAALTLAVGTANAGTSVQLELAGTYKTNVFDEGAAEIPAYDAASKRLFVVDGATDAIDVLSLSDPANPVKIGSLSSRGYGSPNSVATGRGFVAIAVEAEPKTDPGHVLFYTVQGVYKGAVQVGAQPDMVVFSRDGNTVMTADEGEAAEGGSPNPEGTVSIIDFTHGPHNAQVTTLRFNGYTKPQLRAKGVRFVDPNATAAQDLEPEYIAVSADGSKAWVTLQENNALAIIDVPERSIEDIVGLGSKNFNLPGNGIDASDKDGKINITNWPARGYYMPDSIAAFTAKGKTYLITANEGDDRDDFLPKGEEETVRVKDLTLDPVVFPNAAELQEDENLGRLTVSRINGDPDGDGKYNALYAYGARSFSIWTPEGKQVYDSGDDFERITAAQLPADFNSNNDENDSFDNRSDNKGPEPEGVVVGSDNGHLFAFVGLERIGGVMVYNVDNPMAPKFLQYVNNRDFAGDAEAGTAGDLGPEGLAFVPSYQSPTGTALLIVANEVSGSTTIYNVNRVSLR